MLNYVFGAFGLSTLWLLPLLWRLLKSLVYRDLPLLTAPQGPARFWGGALAVLLSSTALEGLLVWSVTRNPASGAWGTRMLALALSSQLGIGLSVVLMLAVLLLALPYYLGFAWRDLRTLAQHNPMEWVLVGSGKVRDGMASLLQHLPGVGRGARRSGRKRSSRRSWAKSGRAGSRSTANPVGSVRSATNPATGSSPSEMAAPPITTGFAAGQATQVIDEPWRIPKRDTAVRPAGQVVDEFPLQTGLARQMPPRMTIEPVALPVSRATATGAGISRMPPVPAEVRAADEVFRTRGRAPDPIADWLQKPVQEPTSLPSRPSLTPRRRSVPAGASLPSLSAKGSHAAASLSVETGSEQIYEDALQRFQLRVQQEARQRAHQLVGEGGASAVPTQPAVELAPGALAEASMPLEVQAAVPTVAALGPDAALEPVTHIPPSSMDTVAAEASLSEITMVPSPELVAAVVAGLPAQQVASPEPQPAVESANPLNTVPSSLAASPVILSAASQPAAPPLSLAAESEPPTPLSPFAASPGAALSSAVTSSPPESEPAQQEDSLAVSMVTAAASSGLVQDRVIPVVDPLLAAPQPFPRAESMVAEMTMESQPRLASVDVASSAAPDLDDIASDWPQASEAALDYTPEVQASLLPHPPIKKATAPLPPLDLLSAPTIQTHGVDEDQLAETGILIEQRLREFKVPVSVVGAGAGPVITRFEVEPAVGVRGNQVVALMKDLARGLGRTSIRVVETIPGKTCMGLELPNEQRQMIALSEILDSAEYRDSDSLLTLAMGKGITGEPVVADLAKAPHMLVAGTTGSGKSVAVNAMILSLLYKATPEQVRLIMIDPKMLELSVYEGIPHLLAPVVTDMKLAANALAWCVGEMENRYRMMSELRVRNLAGFNHKVQEAREAGRPLWNPYPAHPEVPEYLDTLPMIVVVIDELADLMMVAGKKIEELIARLAQKARAAGIHLILATQRPSVDVITGLIKANIPTRVAFQVSSKIDSRTILDQMGAESLLGQGDMLFLPPGTGYPQRVHGAFVADEEVLRVVAFLKQFGEPDYKDEILAEEVSEVATEGGTDASNAEADPLYDEAAEFVLRTRRASISFVQRQFRIGYNRAARLVEAMEAAGLVSGMGPNGQREVLAPGRTD